MHCPYCGAKSSKVINTTRAGGSGVRRRRECKSCSIRFTTFEHAALTMPLLVKHDGNREEFDRDKLVHSVQMACAKRPVSLVEIQDLALEIEHRLQHMGSEEVPSRLIGDMVLRGLRDVDEVACIRYALIYLQLNELDDVLSEIDRVMTVEMY